MLVALAAAAEAGLDGCLMLLSVLITERSAATLNGRN